MKEIILSVILSADLFLSAAACCTGGIRIPKVSGLVINLICSAMLGASMVISGVIAGFLPEKLFHSVGAAIMISIGAATVLKSLVRFLLPKMCGEKRLKIGDLSLAVQIYLDDTAADLDRSKVISVPEAAMLALASSLDSAATGLSCGTSLNPLTAALATFAAGTLALAAGSALGLKLSAL